MTGASEFFELARDFGRSPAKIAAGLFDTYDEMGDEFAREWGDNVRAVAPNHLPHLPDAITSEMRFAGTSIEVETGPESGRRQGKLGLGDEFGSRNQPPHLNGLRAMGTVQPRLEKAADATIGLALP